MNVETPIASTDPFRACRIAAALLSLLTAALIAATAIDLARRPRAGGRHPAIGRMVPALLTPVAEMTGNDARYGPMVPAALCDADGAGRRGPW